MSDPGWTERIEQLVDFLQGKLPEGVECRHRPKLSPEAAWTVVWFIQELTRAIPDHYERCDGCGVIFDSHGQGYYVDDENYEELGRKRSDIGKHYCGDWCNI